MLLEGYWFFGIVLSFQDWLLIKEVSASVHDYQTWKLTTVYGPCDDPARSDFVSWFQDHDTSDLENWIFLGDFNFYRLLSIRNRPSGNLADTFTFTKAIGHLAVVELPLKGRAYTWSNMQMDPLLEQLD